MGGPGRIAPYRGSVDEHGLAEAGGRGMHPPVGEGFDSCVGKSAEGEDGEEKFHLKRELKTET